MYFIFLIYKIRANRLYDLVQGKENVGKCVIIYLCTHTNNVIFVIVY